jgi:Peptidase family M48
MRDGFVFVAASVLFLVSLRGDLLPPLHAQPQNETTTFEGTDQGGWSGPCEGWWRTSGLSLDAARVCRVTTNLITALERTPNAALATSIANQLFRICWGDFPRFGNACATSNAWAQAQGWIATPGAKPPVVITLQATEDLQSDDEVAFVLGHEMGHAVDREQTVDQNTRQNEERADVLGIGFVMRAGYDARSSGRGLQMVLGERGQGLLGNLASMWEHRGDGADVHGLTQNRIALMKQVFARGCAALNNQAVGCRDGWR